ncbi:ABC transporter ATP-binding protein [Protaetiibacter sp. 10F1B-8-1]|uniref:ABC transporter ATP-binding protein n=1 Tax=Protaetiibacter mangrovi TaxID=2970926 RepID=A0ABT1ZGU3_9MICO|nr:ABC transporter ATP-binding protein [Protaetiibacter mangrovi]
MRDLVVSTDADAPVRILDGVSLDVRSGRTTALIGESGSGKSILGSAVMGLLPDTMSAQGEIVFDDRQVLGIPERQRRALRGRWVAMIFQDPLAALNPSQRIGRQVGELLRRGGLRGKALEEGVVRLLARVGVPRPEERAHAFPHQLSGGLRQRAVIAMALSGGPRLLIADEPTTALDVTVQKRILDLLAEMQRDDGIAILFISHDLRVVSHIADDLVVLYAGRVAESGPARSVLSKPLHPYTRALARSVPSVSAASAVSDPIPGTAASPAARPSGCAFHPRCPLAREICRRETPQPREVVPGRVSACHFAEEFLDD